MRNTLQFHYYWYILSCNTDILARQGSRSRSSDSATGSTPMTLKRRKTPLSVSRLPMMLVSTFSIRQKFMVRSWDNPRFWRSRKTDGGGFETHQCSQRELCAQHKVIQKCQGAIDAKQMGTQPKASYRRNQAESQEFGAWSCGRRFCPSTRLRNRDGVDMPGIRLDRQKRLCSLLGNQWVGCCRYQISPCRLLPVESD